MTYNVLMDDGDVNSLTHWLRISGTGVASRRTAVKL